MARSSEDLALLLQVLEGSTAAVESLARPRFVVLEGPAEFRLAPAIPLALQSVVQGLEARGFQTERFSHPGLRRGARLWLARMGVAQDQPGMRRFQEILKDGAPVRLTTEWARTLLGKGRHTVPVLALASFENGMRRFQSVFEKDLALASELEQVLTERLRDDGVLLLPAFARTRMRHHEAKLRPFHFGQGGVFNVLEMPAVVVPVGVAEDGSPVALQVVAARGRDELAIRAAGEIERKLPPAQGGWR
jgi:Asp-tRNA(Asn)/Glu-tRNA(Gln) amidotransferase A subunit family amidase